MCKAPLTTLLMAALLGAASSASAHDVKAASAALPPAANPEKQVITERPGTVKAAQSNAVLLPEQIPAPSPMVASAYRDVDRIAPTRPGASASPDSQKNSGWRYTAALLGTLAIIGTIAVRRRKAEMPWA